MLFIEHGGDENLKYVNATAEVENKEQIVKQLERTIKQLKDDSTPRFKGDTPQVITALAEDGFADFLFPIRVINGGAPSAAYLWHLYWKSPSMDTTFTFTRLGTLNLNDEAKGIAGVLTDAEGIVEKNDETD